jgi:class 3 adenylate cyclase
MLGELLVLPDYRLIFAGNGFEALAKVDEFAPDLILLDVMMPGMNGFEVCQRLKAEQRWRHIPVILVTALDSVEDLAYGLEAGADDFVSKPVNSLELRARVRSLLRIKSQYDALEKQQHELEASLRLNERFAQAFAQHLEALEILHDTGLHLIDNLDTDSILNLIAQTALDLIAEADGCVIHLLADDGQHLLPIIFTRDHYEKTVQASVGIEDIVSQVIETGQALHISERTVEQPQPEFLEMRALSVTPLLHEQCRLGTLTIYSSEVDAFEMGHQHILSILSQQAAVAITKARFFKARALTKEREKQAIRSIFECYVSPAVVERLVEGRETLALGGQRQDVSVLFADIRGFTAFSENLPPERVVEALNRYLALAVEPILAEDGTLDKFVGDAIMAIFNAPLPQSDYVLRAVQAALGMQQAIFGYNSKAAGPALSFGIGIHTGPVVVGNIGTIKQMNYTAIGDTINLAKRLQENASEGQILLSQAALEAVQDVVAVEDLGLLTVKGRTAAEHVYQLIGLR